MTQIYNKALHKTITISRVIGKIIGDKKGATIVFFAGIHGNETAGVFALDKVLKTIDKKEVNGTIYAISGNLKALKENKRFIYEDLNRIWTDDYLKQLETKKNIQYEEQEQAQLFSLLNTIIETETGPFYFIDLHTTSSKTLPFITINDAIINRKFSKLFPVPVVLGIEEFLDGPLLSYINKLGYLSLGFESGQHEEEDAVLGAESFIYLALVYANVLLQNPKSDFLNHYNRLKHLAKQNDTAFEIVFRYNISNTEDFKMKKGFESFQNINKGALLATSNKKLVFSKYTATLFMPLYQKKGNDGYYLIKKINPFFLKLSSTLRKLKVYKLLIFLPGISWQDSTKEVLKVNLKTARYFAKSIFHLLGYRSSYIDNTHLKFYNRELVAKTEMYKSKFWYIK